MRCIISRPAHIWVQNDGGPLLQRFRSVGLGLSARPSYGPHQHRVDTGPQPVQNLLLGELLEQGSVQLLPDSGLLPLAQSAPGDVPGSASQGWGQVPPLVPGVQHEQDALQSGTVIDARSSARASGQWLGRAQRNHQLPQTVIDLLRLRRRHAGSMKPAPDGRHRQSTLRSGLNSGRFTAPVSISL